MDKQFQLRGWQMDDLDDLVLFANNIKIASRLSDAFPHPYTREDGRQFISKATSGDGRLVYAIEIDDRIAGGIGLHPLSDIFRNNAELGYWLAEPYWGMGIMTAVIQKVVRIGFEKLPINRIFARPFGSNIASQRVLEKAGFVLEGRFTRTIIKNGRLEDELIYAIRKD